MTGSIQRPGRPKSAREEIGLPALIAQASEAARSRFVELFSSPAFQSDGQERARPIFDFLDWAAKEGVRAIDDVNRSHVLAWLQIQRQSFAASTAKARLICLQHLFEWMTASGALSRNPSASVRPPIVVQRSYKAPDVSHELAIALVESIQIETPRDRRDRALIAMMVLRSLKASEAVALNVNNVLLHDGSVDPSVPDRGQTGSDILAILPLIDCVRDYVDNCDLRADRAGPLFRAARQKTGELTISRLRHPSVRYLLRQRALAAGMLITTSKDRVESIIPQLMP